MRVKILIILIPVLFCSCRKGPLSEAEDLGIFGKDRKESVLGQDGCTPIRLNDTIMMWTFGDTILGDWKGDLSVYSTFDQIAVMKGMIPNSLAFSESPDDDNFESIKFSYYSKNGKVVPFITDRNKNPRIWRYWAVGGIVQSGSAYVFYMIIEIPDAVKSLNFKYRGMGLAEWKIPLKWKVGDAVDFSKQSRIFPEDHPTFGDSVIEIDGYLYLSGHGVPDTPSNASAFVARVRKEEIRNLKSYEFLTKDGSWSPDIQESHGMFGDVAGEYSLSFNKKLEEFLIIYCSTAGKIKLGRFREIKKMPEIKPVEIFEPKKISASKDRPLMYYSAKEIYYTDKAVYAVYMNPAIYQPMLLKIKY
ncbi:MAG: DUF4185 domain-containing protein [Spirochaetes bacterium]|nr:DUF4185 domain-containing protein [Spirochaetota bacterium]